MRNAAGGNQGIGASQEYETEEKKAQVRGDIRHLLVCVPGPAGRRDIEIPDAGGAFRVIRLGRDHTDSFGRPAYCGGYIFTKE